ncbi:peptide deformylase [Patescibacteria group bacterium]|nr:peptide deformylase [Patescibacteria group bacterium]
MPNKIVTIEAKKNEDFLRRQTVPFDFKAHTKKEITDLVRKMRQMMKEADGVGLSANQIGLNYRMFVAQVPDSQGHPKFYAVFNPEVSKLSKEMETLEEGCLSVPETYGPTPRHYRLTLAGFGPNGKKLKINAWGLLARVFQHETDHLDGKLFLDRAEKLYHVGEEN